MITTRLALMPMSALPASLLEHVPPGMPDVWLVRDVSDPVHDTPNGLACVVLMDPRPFGPGSDDDVACVVPLHWLVFDIEDVWINA